MTIINNLYEISIYIYNHFLVKVRIKYTYIFKLYAYN